MCLLTFRISGAVSRVVALITVYPLQSGMSILGQTNQMTNYLYSLRLVSPAELPQYLS
jgi:hypothetical protein